MDNEEARSRCGGWTQGDWRGQKRTFERVRQSSVSIHVFTRWCTPKQIRHIATYVANRKRIFGDNQWHNLLIMMSFPLCALSFCFSATQSQSVPFSIFYITFIHASSVAKYRDAVRNEEIFVAGTRPTSHRVGRSVRRSVGLSVRLSYLKLLDEFLSNFVRTFSRVIAPDHFLFFFIR